MEQCQFTSFFGKRTEEMDIMLPIQTLTMPTDKLENDRRLVVQKHRQMMDSPRASPKVPVGVRRKAPLQVAVFHTSSLSYEQFFIY